MGWLKILATIAKAIVTKIHLTVPKVRSILSTFGLTKAISCLSWDTSCLSWDISCSTMTNLSEFLISCCRIAPSYCCFDSVFATFYCPYLPNSLDRSVAVFTASINAERNPALSNLATPAIVVPPGLVTRSLSSPGCIPVSLTKIAVPNTV